MRWFGMQHAIEVCNLAPIQSEAAAQGKVVSFVLTINDSRYEVEIEPRVTLLDALREVVGLTGTKRVVHMVNVALVRC